MQAGDCGAGGCAWPATRRIVASLWRTTMKIGCGIVGTVGILSLVACIDIPPDEPPWAGSTTGFGTTESTGFGGSFPITTGSAGGTVGAGGFPFDGGFGPKIDAGVY